MLKQIVPRAKGKTVQRATRCLHQISHCLAKLARSRMSARLRYLTAKLHQFYLRDLSLTYRFWTLWDNLQYYLKLSETSADFGLRAIRLPLLLLSIRCFEITLLGVVHFDAHQQLVLHDMALFYHYPIQCNLLATCFGLQTIFFTWQMYTFQSGKSCPSPLVPVRQILFEADGSFLLARRQDLKEVSGIRRTAKRLLIGCRYFVSILVVEMAYFYLYLLVYGLFFGALSGCLEILFALVNALLNTFYFIAFSLVNINATAIIFVFTRASFLRLRQVNTLLVSPHQSTHQLRRFAALHTQTLVAIAGGSHYFGGLILAFILIYLPVNTFLLLQIVLGRFNYLLTYVFSNVILFQYVYIFGLHLAAGTYTSRLHKCRKRLFGIAASCRIDSLWAKIKLANYIHKFHCKRRYGVNYGTFGLISIRSFSKFVLLYSQFIMCSYQLMEGFIGARRKARV